jgi:hypothetical protein
MSERVQFLIGAVLALVIWGLQLIGVTVNIWLGAIVLAAAFVLMTRAFWIWEGPSRWHVAWRVVTVSLAALIYISAVGWQMRIEWAREHPPILHSATPEMKESDQATHNENSEPPPTVNSIPTAKPKKQEIVSSGTPVPRIQSAPSGINIGGDNNGTATVNNFGHAPPRLADAMQSYVASQLGEFAGQSVELDVDRATPETDAFAKSLMASLSLAHISVQRQDAMFVGGCLNIPGVSFMVGTNRTKMAAAIWNALETAGSVEGKGQGCSRSGEPNELVINIRPPN